MPGQRPILAMSFVASLGITLEVLACTLPKGQGNFWPLLIFIFYLILPVPVLISRRMVNTALGMNDGSVKKIRDYSLFMTAGIMISSMALPIVLARTPIDKPIIAPISCFVVELGNLLCYATIGLFCVYFKPLDGL